jgi:hypothetical protein
MELVRKVGERIWRKLQSSSKRMCSLSAVSLSVTLLLQSTITSAFYVNCNGGGGGNGTQASPFGSLQQTQMAMRTSTVKTAIVSGTCNLSGDWNFSTADNGETWEAACGQVTTITGGTITVGKTSDLAFYGFNFNDLASGKDKGGFNLDNTTNFTFRWNTMLDCTDACMAGHHNESSVIDSNTFNGMMSPGSATGAHSGPVWFVSSSDGNLISHNLVENDNGMGFGINGVGTEAPQNDSYIGNLIEGACLAASDCGALYFYGPGSPAQSGDVIEGNAVMSMGPNQNKCIFLDNGMSGVQVTGNLCAGSGNNMPTYDVSYHGGSGDVVNGNTFEVGSGSRVVLYQSASYGGTPMTGNEFEDNTVYTPNGWPSPLWQGTGITPPTVSGNHYYSPNGASVSNYGVGVDTNPTFGTIPSNISLSDPSSMLTDQGPSLNSVCPNGY